MEPMMHLVCVEWTETERGWGCRPDGATFHASIDDAKAYVADYWASEKKRNPSGIVPNEYSYPHDAYILVDAPSHLYAQVMSSKRGVMVCQSEYSKLRFPNGWSSGAKNALNPRKIVPETGHEIGLTRANELLKKQKTEACSRGR